MSIVDTSAPITAAGCRQAIDRLVATYPFFRSEQLATTAFQRQICALRLGSGPRRVLFTAAHHANEWITALVLLEYAAQLGQALEEGGFFRQWDARQLAEAVTIYMVPMVNPDGVDLVTGAVTEEGQLALARRLGENYPQIPFPSGWKANLLGVDLNLQYPAGWQQARRIKFSQGFDRPGPRDYVGAAALDQTETRALAAYTQRLDPALVVALHTQGEVIYWRYQDILIPDARQLGEKMAAVSGYALSETPYASGFAGYKDWFIQRFRRPGFTIEAGKGENPLPLTQFPRIYDQCADLLTVAALGR